MDVELDADKRPVLPSHLHLLLRLAMHTTISKPHGRCYSPLLDLVYPSSTPFFVIDTSLLRFIFLVSLS
jgi:hypothetical protein